ncbi:hypothetical protein JXB28_06645 [Candidatus Woesearchaeota archaeon]|nr:hypothetical protein [Candidatus Woesearchaeota archaeon]
MWPFANKEDKKINATVSNIAEFIVSRLEGRGLISLYLAGTILSRKERVPDSDIDFFGVMSSDFNPAEEEAINSELEKQKESLCKGFECRFRGFFLDELQSGKPRSMVGKLMRPERLAQRFPFFKLVWGKKFNYKKDFVKPMQLKDEANFLIEFIEKAIKDLRAKKQKFPVEDFPKFIIELIRVEAMMFQGYNYHPDRKRLQHFLRKQESHIIHKAMDLRRRKAGWDEMVAFCADVEKYIAGLKEMTRKL